MFRTSTSAMLKWNVISTSTETSPAAVTDRWPCSLQSVVLVSVWCTSGCWWQRSAWDSVLSIWFCWRPTWHYATASKRPGVVFYRPTWCRQRFTQISDRFWYSDAEYWIARLHQWCNIWRHAEEKWRFKTYHQYVEPASSHLFSNRKNDMVVYKAAHSADWLYALLISSLGLCLSNDAVQLAVSMRVRVKACKDPVVW